MLSAMSHVVASGRETCTTKSTGQSLAPGQSRTELFIALAIFCAACLYLWPLRDFVTFNANEGITLAGAERILQGQVPYRDFFTFVTPGSPYLMALWFKLFGSTFVVARSVMLVYAGVFAVITYRLASRTGSRSSAWFAAALLTFGCMPFDLMALHNWDSTLFALLAIYCAQSLLREPSQFFSLCLGCSTALTFLTEHSKGAGLLLGLAMAALALRLSRRSRSPVSNAKLWPGVVGFVIPVAVTFAYFASQHATRVMVEDWLWPLRHYSAVNHSIYGALPVAGGLTEVLGSTAWGVRAMILAFLAPTLLVSAFALLVIAATFYAIWIRWSGAPSQAVDARVLGGCAFLGILLSILSTSHADLNHILYMTPLFIYLVPSILEIHYKGDRLFRQTRPVAAVLLLALFTGFGLITILKAAKPSAKLQTRRGTVRFAYPDEVLPYVQKYVPEGQHLYVHPYQAFYSYMTATINPTRVIFLQPGFNTADQYEATLGDLVADRTPFVLLNTDFTDKIPSVWPSTPAESLARDPIEEYILKHYRTCQVLNRTPQQTWRFNFMVRADLSCPAGH
jgi:4-amino-4-deoxy-L-arabinose transferase-like glycosyltransferase